VNHDHDQVTQALHPRPPTIAIPRVAEPLPVSISQARHAGWRQTATEVWLLAEQLRRVAYLAEAIYRGVKTCSVFEVSDLEHVCGFFPEAPYLSCWGLVLRHFAGVAISGRGPTAALGTEQLGVEQVCYAQVALLRVGGAALDGLKRHGVEIDFAPFPKYPGGPLAPDETEAYVPWIPDQGLEPLPLLTVLEWDALLTSTTPVDPFRPDFPADYARLTIRLDHFRDRLRSTPSTVIPHPTLEDPPPPPEPSPPAAAVATPAETTSDSHATSTGSRPLRVGEPDKGSLEYPVFVGEEEVWRIDTRHKGGKQQLAYLKCLIGARGESLNFKQASELDTFLSGGNTTKITQPVHDKLKSYVKYGGHPGKGWKVRPEYVAAGVK
jgi:hypothetical protein